MTKILNGYIHRAQQKSEFTSLTLVFPTGSIYETPGRHGISHLMEHLICKLVDKYQDRFLNDCIDFNAETDFNYVQFYFRGLESKLPPEFKRELVTALLSGFDSITEEQFEMEKQIVIQEITDDYDDPYLGNLFNCFYRYYNIIEPGGIIDDVKNFSFADAKKMYEDVFTKPLRIVEVGKEWSHFEDIEYCDKLPFKVLPKFKVTKKKLAETLEGDKSLVMVFGKRLLKRSDYQYMRIASVMLLQGLNSPFVQELREKRGLTYDISLEFQPVQDHCIFWLCATTDDDHAALDPNIGQAHQGVGGDVEPHLLHRNQAARACDGSPRRDGNLSHGVEHDRNAYRRRARSHLHEGRAALSLYGKRPAAGDRIVACAEGHCGGLRLSIDGNDLDGDIGKHRELRHRRNALRPVA